MKSFYFLLIVILEGFNDNWNFYYAGYLGIYNLVNYFISYFSIFVSCLMMGIEAS